MKRSWIGFALLLVLLAGGIAATVGMEKCHEPIARDLANAAEQTVNGDWEQAQAHLLRAKSAWGSTRKFAACFADHTPMEEVSAELAAMEEIDALFAQVEVYAAAREEAEFAAGCAELSRRMEAMANAHGAQWWNVL